MVWHRAITCTAGGGNLAAEILQHGPLRGIDIEAVDVDAGADQTRRKHRAQQAKTDDSDGRVRCHDLLRLDAGGPAGLAPTHDLALDEDVELGHSGLNIGA